MFTEFLLADQSHVLPIKLPKRITVNTDESVVLWRISANPRVNLSTVLLKLANEWLRLIPFMLLAEKMEVSEGKKNAASLK